MGKSQIGSIKEPDLSFLDELLQIRSKFKGYQTENEHITSLRISFSPRRIPPSVTGLKFLERDNNNKILSYWSWF